MRHCSGSSIHTRDQRTLLCRARPRLFGSDWPVSGSRGDACGPPADRRVALERKTAFLGYMCVCVETDVGERVAVRHQIVPVGEPPLENVERRKAKTAFIGGLLAEVRLGLVQRGP